MNLDYDFLLEFFFFFCWGFSSGRNEFFFLSSSSPFFFFQYLFIWLCLVLVAACVIFSRSMQTLSWGMWDLVP